MVDNGRFSHFILGNDLNSYIGIENPNDMYMLGITPKKRGGYISNNPVVSNMKQYGPGGWFDDVKNIMKSMARTIVDKEARRAEVYDSNKYTFD
jgi:hypothetical protein